MRHILAFCFFYCSIVILSSAQDTKISGKIVDSRTEDVLPFANIMVKGHTIGTSTDIHGDFELLITDSLKQDSIIVSFVGYYTKTLCVNDIVDNMIRLDPRVFEADEIVITPSKGKRKPLVINPFKRKDCNVRYRPAASESGSWIPMRPEEPAIEAIYFPHLDKYGSYPIIKEVWLQVTNYKNPPTFFNLRLYSGDTVLGPCNDLINEIITVEVSESKQLVKINLESYGLVMPEKGLFVGFELLIIKKNQTKIQDQDEKELVLYSPYLNFLREEQKGSFWLYSGGKWHETTQETSHYFKKNVVLYYKPAVSLVL